MDLFVLLEKNRTFVDSAFSKESLERLVRNHGDPAKEYVIFQAVSHCSYGPVPPPKEVVPMGWRFSSKPTIS